MARFEKGQSGNPGGRPKGPNARSAIREALDKPEAAGATRTRLQAWADELAQAAAPADRLAVLRFLEGSQPPPEDDGDGKPLVHRIEIVHDDLDPTRKRYDVGRENGRLDDDPDA